MFENVINLVPAFAAVLLFLAYLMWSKFLNRDKLKFENINAVFDILLLLLFLCGSIGGGITIYLIIVSMINLNLNLMTIFNISPSLIIFVGLIIITLFITKYRNKKVGRKDLMNILTNIEHSYILIMGLFLGISVFIYFSPFQPVFSTGLALLLFFLILTIIACSQFSTEPLLNKDLNPLSSWKAKGIFIILFIVGILIATLIFPWVNVGDSKIVSYQIYNIGDFSNKTYEVVETPISILNYGLITNFISVIPVNYRKSNLITDIPLMQNYFAIDAQVNDSLKYSLISSWSDIGNIGSPFNNGHGFTGAKIDANNGLILIKFNKTQMKEEKITKLLLKGLSNQNVRIADFSYNTNLNQDDYCNSTGCIILINVSNNLLVPVNVMQNQIFNINKNFFINSSNCKFIEASFLNPEYYKEVLTREPECTGKSCLLETDWSAEKPFRSHSALQFVLDDSGEGIQLINHFSYFDTKSKVNVRITIQCL